MARNFNYTGRLRILQEHVGIEIIRTEDGIGFDAQINLKGYNLPADAQVWVEAYRKASRMHFAYGTCADCSPPDNRSLSEFDSPDGIHFRVRVTAVGDEHGKLLAAADKIKPSATPNSDTYASSLIGLRSAPLNGRVWAIEIEDTGPYLVLDDSIEDRQIVVGKDAFLSLVMPAVFREVMANIFIHDPDWENDDEAAWQRKWLQLSRGLPGIGEPPEREADNHEALADWVDECTSAFAKGIDSLARFSRMQAEENK